MTTSNWNEQRLNSLILDEEPESLILEYKRSEALNPKTDRIKNEISKDVSAFANSVGGIIIYGIIEVSHKPKSIDGIDPSHVTKEWLEQVISSRIQRRINNIRIYQVPLSNGKVVYIVDIPSSDWAPHMAYDKRYYKRFNFQSIPMEDYEVRDVVNRATGPRLTINISLSINTLTFPDENNRSSKFQINANVKNESNVPAEHAVFHFIADSRIAGNPAGFTNKREVFINYKDSNISNNLWQLNWGIPGMMPIWNGMVFNLFDSAYTVDLPKGNGEYILGWSAKAPRMNNASELLILFVRDDGSIKLQNAGISLQF